MPNHGLAPSAGENIAADLPMYDALKSGVLLCRTVNKIRPNLVANIGTKALGMVERVCLPVPVLACVSNVLIFWFQENIQQYLNACAKLGMTATDQFVISDLHDRRYMPGVCGRTPTSLHSRAVCCLARSVFDYLYSQPSHMRFGFPGAAQRDGTCESGGEPEQHGHDAQDAPHHRRCEPRQGSRRA